MVFKIHSRTKNSIYKQIVEQVERGVRDGSLTPGEQLPSMNVLADRHRISRETVKKAYGILVDHGFVEPRHGKGFYVKDITRSGARFRILVVFDKFSVYKQIAFDAFAETLPQGTEITILSHEQNPDLLEYFLDTHLDNFDYYVIAPHFPGMEEEQKRIVKLLERVPVRKLILIDNLQAGMKGHFGSVYQDFDNDIHDCLVKNISPSAKLGNLRVITLASSMYGPRITKSVERFAAERGIEVECMYGVPETVNKGDTFLLLNSSLDSGLVELSRKIKDNGLQIGKDVKIISYNEYPMNELILGGLTTVSTDFPEMGRLAAEMIINHNLVKTRNPFRMTRRKSF